MSKTIGHQQLLDARRTAEAAVADLADGEWKLVTYRTILDNLVRHELARNTQEVSEAVPKLSSPRKAAKAKGTTGRVLGLVEEGFFRQPRTLKEIKEKLAEKGFHYRLEDIGTPLTRIVQRRDLRRSQAVTNGKKLWRYSDY